jgi:RNA polymerase sigma factor (sigma-70 family)
MINKLATKYNVGIFDYEELTQQGLIGLTKAAATFKEDKGYQFSTYACVCIRNSILIYMRDSTRNKITTVSFGADIDNTEGLHMEDKVQDEFSLDVYIIIKDILNQLEVLIGKEATEIFKLHKIHGYKYKEIQKSLNVSIYKVRKSITAANMALYYIKEST